MRSGNFQILMPPGGVLVCPQPFRSGVGGLADLGVFILWQSRVWGSGPERWCRDPGFKVL